MKSLIVAKRFDGTWTIKAPGVTKALSLHKSMEEAIATAKRKIASSGGGELHLKVNYQTQVEIVLQDSGN